MKRAIALLMLLMFTISLSGCFSLFDSPGSSGSFGSSSTGKQKQVPDEYIKLDVEDYIYDNDIEDAYTYTAQHSYDTSSGLDRVTITIRIQHTCADEVISGTATYQYNSSAKTWSNVSSARWGEMVVEYKPSAFYKTHSGTLAYYSGSHSEYEITIHNLDLNKGTITCSYSIVAVDSQLFGGQIHTVDGEGTFDLKSSDWRSFIIPGDTSSFRVTLQKDGIYVMMSS